MITHLLSADDTNIFLLIVFIVLEAVAGFLVLDGARAQTDSLEPSQLLRDVACLLWVVKAAAVFWIAENFLPHVVCISLT